MHRTPKECHLMYPPHNCCLYDCPPDDPEHIHICFAGDFDYSEGDVVKLKLGLITLAEFNHVGLERAARRLETVPRVTADDLRQQSYQTAMMNRFERGLQITIDERE